jgi:hypothetical protein
MGFFKSVRELNAQGREIRRTWDPSAQMAGAQAAMAAAGDSMARQAAAVDGVEATATIAAVRPGGGMINHDPILEIDLIVVIGATPQAATATQVVPQAHLARLQPGATLKARVDPRDSRNVWLDFS